MKKYTFQDEIAALIKENISSNGSMLFHESAAKDIVNFLRETMSEWMPSRKSSSISTANETWNEALSQTEKNFREFINSQEEGK